MVLTLNQFLPEVPLLYYGDEIGLEGENDPGCRATMPTILNPSQTSFRERLRPILTMRQRHLALSHGSFTVIET
jgi:cyclomaltodextrinase